MRKITKAVAKTLPSSFFLLPSKISSFFPHNDCEELVKILVTRCKTLNTAEDKEETKK